METKTAKDWIEEGDKFLYTDHVKALNCYDKALELEPDNVEAWNDKGLLLYFTKRHDEAITCFDKAIELEPDNNKAWYNKGLLLYSTKHYDEAITCFDKAIELEPDNNKAWYNKGLLLYSIKRYDKAITYFDKIIELEPDNLEALYCKGLSLNSLERYEEAITYFNKIIELEPDNLEALYSKGLSLNSLERYKEAITCYNKAIKLNPKMGLLIWCQKGSALNSLGRYEEAITYFDKAIKLNPNNGIAWCQKGETLIFLERYKEAIKCFNKAIPLYPSEEPNWARKNKGVAYVKLHRKYPDKYSLEKAKDLFKKSGLCSDIIAVYSSVLSQLTERERMDIALLMIEEDNTYKQISKKESLVGTDKEKYYKKIFIKSRAILSSLHVKEKEARQGIAHYTTPKMLRILILEDLKKEEEKNSKNEGKEKEAKDKKKHPSPLRLHLINLLNDSREGRTLMDYLCGEYNPEEDSSIIALSASFTFNRDCLNQFRLYGKEDGKEGAGVSIIVKESFFANTPIAPSKNDRIENDLKKQITSSESRKTFASLTNLSSTTKTEITSDLKDDRKALFRCLYVDPVTQQVISVGQREEYTFYRDRLTGKEDDETKEKIKKQVGKNIKKYREDMNKLIEEIQKEIDNILKIIKENDLDFNIVAELLVDLRCLTKHVAFREEQECRIVKVVDYMKDDKVKHRDDYGQLYTDYLPLIPDSNNPKENHVKEVCFGPHFKYREVYAAELNKLGIHSTRSTHPLA
ncbi:MAG: tetratricopeptide repeat protein [Prevotellaceae bacterium]|jgi:tetratricopeptide (TPR) repeat protein|nr:tetratricopeptide repeat protein [Prevotellaceae bacterium]